MKQNRSVVGYARAADQPSAAVTTTVTTSAPFRAARRSAAMSAVCTRRESRSSSRSIGHQFGLGPLACASFSGMLTRMLAKLAALSVLAFVLVCGYALYLQPGWESWRDDQRQYVLLARGLAVRGEFTRAPVGDPFVPEPLRTPGYPLLLAPLCATVGCDHWQIAAAQAVAATALPFLAYLLARRWGRRIAFASAAACTVYLPFA